MRVLRYLLIMGCVIGCGGSNDGAAGDAGVDASMDNGDGGVLPESQRPCRFERVLTADQTVVYASTITYDDSGRVAVLSLENGWDFLEAPQDVSDTSQRDLYYSYDHRGGLALLEVDNDRDGVIEWARYHFRDATTGQLEYWIEDTNIADGWMTTAKGTYTYEDGKQKTFQVLNPMDVPIATSTYVYDGDVLASVENNREPVNVNRECLDAKDQRFYDEEGRIVRLEIDGNNHTTIDCTVDEDLLDGAPDWIVHYDYDDEGRLIQRRYDDGNDGSIDRRETISYDCP